MNRRATLSQWAERAGVELVFLDPASAFDGAILGVVSGFGQEPAVLYDEATVLAALVAQGMPWADAQEWFSFNTVGAYLGPATPRFLSVRVKPYA
jgi:hypothetical protein